MAKGFNKDGRYVNPGDPLDGTLVVDGRPGGTRPKPLKEQAQQIKSNVKGAAKRLVTGVRYAAGKAGSSLSKMVPGKTVVKFKR